MAKKGLLNKINNKKIIAGFLTLTILSLLVLSGSAQALIVKFLISSGKIVDRGEILMFNLSVESERDKPEMINHLILRLEGPRDYECKFKKDGEKIKGCEGVTIIAIPISCDPYAYDPYDPDCSVSYNAYDPYNPYSSYPTSDRVHYIITLNTSTYAPGTYKTEIMIYGTENTIEEGEDVQIRSIGNDIFDICSIRADKGTLTVGELDLGTSNKLSFYKTRPDGRSANIGQGSLKGQSRRDRLNYGFKIKEVLENTKDHAIIAIEGNYRIGRNGLKKEKSIIEIDKKKRKLNLNGLDVNVNYMNVQVIEGCLDKLKK
jgi:hypothetical protein